MNDIETLRNEFRKFQAAAIQVAPFEYTVADFHEDCRRELENRSISETPANWVIAAEAMHRNMVLIADEYDNWLEEKAMRDEEDRRQEALERRYDFMKEEGLL